ncbi:MAG: hypothetical protein LC746_03050 [Acidobacteria bacterium]|nr:hypothetical protein [Acidobacteriota bacterium]
MKKVLWLALCCACVAVLAAAVFAGGARVDEKAPTGETGLSVGVSGGAEEDLLADEGAQERGDWRASQPVRYEPFGVEVVAGGESLEQYPARGRVYVEAVAGEEYELRVHNPLGVRVAVALSVDGLNTIDARRTTARDASKWVIEPYSTITISGWQMSGTRARRFYFTSERDSYANKLGRPDDVGVITAVFFRERERYAEVVPPRPRPLGEPEDGGARKSAPNRSEPRSPAQPSANSAGAARDRAVAPSDDDEYAATGIGRPVGNSVRWVNLDLEREPAAQVTIRYEYRPALVRLGVLPPRQDADRDPLRRRERARGFKDPRFCPEP